MTEIYNCQLPTALEAFLANIVDGGGKLMGRGSMVVVLLRAIYSAYIVSRPTPVRTLHPITICCAGKIF
jgi:hypothetical protein